MKNAVITAVSAVCALALAAYCGYSFCTDAAFASLNLYVLIPVFIALIILGAVLAHLLHECAHLTVGKICSMGVKVPKIRIFSSSFVQIYPFGAKRMKARMIATAAAGLVFDFALIALGVIAITVPAVPVYLCVALPYAFYEFLLNALPIEYGGGKTDGLVVWELISNQPTAQVMLAILKIQGLQRSGIPLNEMDESLFINVPQLPEDDLNFIILTQLRYEYYKAVGNEEKSQSYLERFNGLKEYLPPDYDESN